MKPSNELFRLIKSLTKSEKRYFKLASTLQLGQKNYMKLFETIENQKEYDEEAIKIKFAKETFIKHLPSEKNHLYNLLLKSLRGFYSDKSAAAILQEQLKNIELLYNKALYAECTKIIRKAKKVAYSYEKFYFLLDIITWEKRLVEEEIVTGDFEFYLNKLIEEETECLEKLRNIAEYQKLYSHIYFAIRRGGFYRNKEEQESVNKIAHHPLIIEKNTALSTKAATACYSIKGLCAVCEYDFDKSFINFEKVIVLMEKNPFIMKELPKRYIKALNNVLSKYMHSSDWDECLNYIKKMRALGNKEGFSSMDIQLILFTYTNISELMVYLYSGNYKKAINELVPTILGGIEKYGEKMNQEVKIIFYYNISRTYLNVGDFKQALKYNNFVLNSSESQLRKDVYTFARLVNLIIHYELGNYDLLDYIIKSTKRYVTKNQANFEFEKVFLKEIKKVIKVKNPDNLKAVFSNFKMELTEVLELPFENSVKQYFDFIAWLDSKIHKESFAEIRENGEGLD